MILFKKMSAGTGIECQFRIGIITFALSITSFLSIHFASAGPWDKVDKNVAVTALGHRAAISCHNCYNGPNNEIYPLAQAKTKISNAISRGADLIELDLSDRGNSQPICVTHLNSSSRCNSGEPWLEDILHHSDLKNSDAMLFLEVKSPWSSGDDFARKIFDLLITEDNTGYATNTRPVFIRTMANNIDYLNKIRNELHNNDKYESLRNKIKFSVLFDDTSNGICWAGRGSIANLQNTILQDVFNRHFDMVELHYQMKDILGALKYAESLGLMTGIWTIPASYGEVFIAAMRDEVDQLTTEYRVDYARDAIRDINVLAYANVWSCYSTSWANYRYNYTDNLYTIWNQLYVNPTSNKYGTPGRLIDPQGQDRFGCSLDFRSKQGYTSRAFEMGDQDNTSTAGFLVTAYVNFDLLSNLPEGTMAILNKSESGGFALELRQYGSSIYLRFGVHVKGEYRYHSYNIHNTNVGGCNQSLNGDDGYFLIGAYDGDGGVYLWIDNRRSGSGGSHQGGVTRNNVSIMAGADPQPSASQKARYYFDGIIQLVSVQQWEKHPSGAN